MKIVIAPDSFKESLTAQQVAEAIKRGFQQSIADVEYLLCPVGDGVNNLLMLKSAELGIAFCSKEMLKKEIPHHVDKRDFLEVLPLIDCLE
ncbi:phosphoserine phosphatase [Streptococcus pneumoniae]|nr:phosphoserine phosphatase [Streptococcus pneumoniae]